MVNGGYQRDDLEIVDYELWDHRGLETRGPAPDLSRPFFSVLGAAQLFGRFAERPFGAILADRIGLPCLNLGYSGAGPSFFLGRPDLIADVNRGAFAIVHIMSGRSLSNSRFRTGINQGVLVPRDRPDAPRSFAEGTYRDFLAKVSPAQAEALRIENRDIYVRQMRALLGRIHVPILLLYWSDRAPEWWESVDDLHPYWGGFPHFVNREVVDLIRPAADAYIELAGARGLPQPLRNRATGEPVAVFPPELFPTYEQRDHNIYYPSPEMHEDAAAAILPAIEALGRAPARATAAERDVLVHLATGPAGPAERALGDAFGRGWRRADRGGLVRLLRAAPELRAVTVDRLRPPRRERTALNLHPLVVLRHPLLHAHLMWRAERDTGAIGAWLRAALDRNEPRLLDGQTRRCAGLGVAEPVDLAVYEAALDRIAHAHVAVVDETGNSFPLVEVRLRAAFPEFVLDPVPRFDADGARREVERTFVDLAASVGPGLLAELERRSRYDLALCRRFR